MASELLILVRDPKVPICLTSEKSPFSIQSNEFDLVLASAPTEEGNLVPHARRVLTVFHDIEALSLSFRLGNDLRTFKPSESTHFLDFQGLSDFFSKVIPRLQIRKEELLDCVKSRLSYFVKNPELTKKTFATLKDLRVFLIYLQLPDLIQFENLELLFYIIEILLHLEPEQLTVLKRWFGSFSQTLFINMVTDLQNIIAVTVAEENGKYEEGEQNMMWQIFHLRIPDYSKLKPIVLLLGFLYDANSLSKQIGEEHFKSSAIANVITVRFQYKIWKSEPNEFSFCNYRWIQDMDFKAMLLEEESKAEQEAEKAKGLQSLTQYFNEHPPAGRIVINAGQLFNLILEVRRDHIIEDSLNNLSGALIGSLKKKLRVKFLGEPGVDEGGLKKEYFQILIKQLFDPMYGMFVEKMNKTVFWFNGFSFECNLNFELIGTLLGLAIYNSINLDLRFPPLVYKKLLNEKVTLADLKTFDSELYIGLSQLLTFNGDVETTYCRTFQIDHESSFGEIHKIDLKPDGENIPVTNENRAEFVELYIDWLVNKSVENQFGYFKKGFERVVTGDAIKLLTGEELNVLICGTPKIDIKDLMKAAIYEGFEKDSQIMKYQLLNPLRPLKVYPNRDFWEVLAEFSDEQLKKFLFFCTGSDRIPITGLQDFIIMKNGEDSDQLPTAHTCFNHLLLPHYSNKAKLKQKMTLALDYAEGFGLL